MTMQLESHTQFLQLVDGHGIAARRLQSAMKYASKAAPENYSLAAAPFQNTW